MTKNNHTVTIPRVELEELEKKVSNADSLKNVVSFSSKNMPPRSNIVYSDISSMPSSMMTGVSFSKTLHLNGDALMSLCSDPDEKERAVLDAGREFGRRPVSIQEIERTLDNAELRAIVLWIDGKPVTFTRS